MRSWDLEAWTLLRELRTCNGKRRALNVFGSMLLLGLSVLVRWGFSMILQDCSIQRLKNNFTLISESPILWATKTSSSLFRNFKFRTQQKRSINANKIFELARVENLVTVFAIVVLWTIAIVAYCTSERIVRLLDVIWDGWLLKAGSGRFKYPIAHSNPKLG